MKTVVSVPGLHCNSCTLLVKDVSSEFPAIKDVNINLTTKRVEIDHTDDLDITAWTKAVEALGEQYAVSRTM